MAEQHPMQPPPELFEHLHRGGDFDFDDVVSSAYAAGADAELEASVQWLIDNKNLRWAEALRAARRPKPLSRRELCLKHLEVMERDGHYLPEIIDDLRKAVEAMPDD